MMHVCFRSMELHNLSIFMALCSSSRYTSLRALCVCLVFYLIVWHRWMFWFAFLVQQQTLFIPIDPKNMYSLSELVFLDRIANHTLLGVINTKKVWKISSKNWTHHRFDLDFELIFCQFLSLQKMTWKSCSQVAKLYVSRIWL